MGCSVCINFIPNCTIHFSSSRITGTRVDRLLQEALILQENFSWEKVGKKSRGAWGSCGICRHRGWHRGLSRLSEVNVLWTKSPSPPVPPQCSTHLLLLIGCGPCPDYNLIRSEVKESDLCELKQTKAFPHPDAIDTGINYYNLWSLIVVNNSCW